MWHSWRIHDSGPLRGRLFDPVTLTAASVASTAVAGGISAAGTLAGGNAAATAGQYALQAGQMQQQAANFQADQITQNASQAVASGQRQALDTAMKTRLAISTARANAGANGVNAAVGSPAEAVGQLARRGSYLAAMDMFNGNSTATGLLNQAAGVRYGGQASLIEGQEKMTEGQMQKSASELAAAGTLAGSAGSMLKTYGGFAYPQSFRS